MDIAQFDVKTSFLYGKLTEPVYMEVPEGKLKQSPRVWNESFTKFLKEFKFMQNEVDECAFIGAIEKDVEKNFEISIE